jgi:hypothetical protein
MIVLEYRVDAGLQKGEGRINPLTRERLAKIGRLRELARPDFQLGPDDSRIIVSDDQKCAPDEIRVSADDQRRIPVSRAEIREEELVPGDPLTAAERAAIRAAAANRNAVRGDKPSGPFLDLTRILARSGRIQALAHAVDEYLELEPAAEAYVNGRLPAIVTNGYLIEALQLPADRVGVATSRHDGYYRGIFSHVRDPKLFVSQLDLFVGLVELGV